MDEVVDTAILERAASFRGETTRIEKAPKSCRHHPEHMSSISASAHLIKLEKLHRSHVHLIDDRLWPQQTPGEDEVRCNIETASNLDLRCSDDASNVASAFRAIQFGRKSFWRLSDAST